MESTAATKAPAEERTRVDEGRDAGSPLLGAALLGLQQSVGNRAVTALVRRLADKPLAGRGLTNGRAAHVRRDADRAPRVDSIQRVLDPAKQAEWDKAGGDAVISAIEGRVDKWKTFRGNPASWSDISKLGSCRPLVTFLEEHSEFRQHVAEKLRANIAFLQEIAGFLPDWRLLLDLVPGLTWKDPKHKYSMSASETSVINAVGYIPVQVLEINYSNAYGWKWKRDVATTGIQWSISIARQSGVPGANIGDLAKGKKDAKGKFKPGTSTSHTGEKGSNPMMPEFAEFNITNAAEATPVKYWGFNDFTGGGAITNGPSVSGKFGPAGTAVATTGGMLKLKGSNGDIDFTEFKSNLKASPTASLKDAINLEFKATLASVGVIGMTTIGDASGISAPAPTKRAIQQSRTFGYVLQGFSVESPTTPIPEGMVASMKSDIEQLRARVEEDRDDLKAEGFDEPFKVTFVIEGFASRSWAGARSDQERQRKNLVLSQQRADYAAKEMAARFGGEHLYQATGKGAALVTLADGVNKQGNVIPEGDADALNKYVERQRLKYIDDQIRFETQNNFNGESAASIRQRVETASHPYAEGVRTSLLASNPKTADSPVAQRVNITISWSGHVIEYSTDAGGSAPAAKPN